MKIKTKVISLLISVLLVFTTSGCSRAEKSPFKVVGAMSTPRANHAATLLQDGRVLITGGTSGFKEFNTAEIFDPKTNKFHKISNMNEPHSYHSATLLKDGRVLIIDTRHNSLVHPRGVEIFNPKTEKFSYITNPNYPQERSKTILLDNGEVFVFGGDGRHIEIFNPKNNTFRVIMDFKDCLVSFDAVKLPNGYTAIFGGNRVGFKANKDILIFDPKTEKIEKACELVFPRPFLKAILLKSNKVLLTGGNDDATQNKAEIYDIASGKSTKISNTTLYYINHTMTLLPNNKVLLIGGYGKTSPKTSEVFNPETNTFKILHNMKFDRGHHTATLLRDGRVLITGGETLRANPRQAEIYDYRLDK